MRACKADNQGFRCQGTECDDFGEDDSRASVKRMVATSNALVSLAEARLSTVLASICCGDAHALSCVIGCIEFYSTLE